MRLGTCVPVLAWLMSWGCVANDQAEKSGGNPGSANGSAAALLGAGDREVLTFESWSVVKVVLNSPASPQLSASFCRFRSPLAWAERLGPDGQCRLLRWLPMDRVPFDAVNLDTGEITVDVGGSSVVLPPADPALPCWREATGPLPAIRAGDTIRVRATGGADVPAFDLSLAVPEAARLSEPATPAAFTIGAPWDFAWTTSRASDMFLEIRGVLDGTDLVASCRGLDATSIRLPPELTGLWPTAASRVRAQVGTEVQTATATEPAVTLRITAFGEFDGMPIDVATVAP